MGDSSSARDARAVPRRWRTPLLAALAVLASALLVVRYTLQHPPSLPLAPQLSPLDAGKVMAAAHSLLALLLVNLATLGASYPLRRLCGPGPAGMNLVLRLTFGLFALAHGVLALGLLRSLTPRSITVMTSAAALVGCLSVLSALRAAPPTGEGLRKLLRSPQALVIAAALLLPTLGAFVPLYGYDALTYHLALPERFLRAGELEFSPFSVFTTFPLLTEMLNTLALAVDRPALAKLLAVELAALLLVSLAAIGGRFGRAGIFLALACVLCDPLLLWETTVVYADIALALLGLLAAASIVEWDAGRDRSALLRAAILAGLCAGTRYQGVVVAASLAFALVMAGRQPLRNRLAGASALALGVAVFVAPWLLRNLVNTGSPFARGAFDPVVVEQLQTYVHKIGMGRGFTSLLLAPWNVTLSPTPDAYVGGFGYQIGPLYLVAAVLAVFTLRRYTLTAFCLCAALAQALVWFHTEQEVRFLLPAFMLVSVAGAEAAGGLASAAPSLHRGLVAVQLWAVMLGQVGFWNGSGSAYRMALGDIPLNLVRGDTPAELIGDLLRAQGRPDLNVLPLFESRAWHLRGVSSIPYHIIDAAPVLLEVHRALRAGELCPWLEGHRITHVLVNDTAARNAWPTFVDGYGQADYEEDLRQLREFLASSTDLRAAIGGVFLYELRPVPCQRPGP